MTPGSDVSIYSTRFCVPQSELNDRFRPRNVNRVMDSLSRDEVAQ
jgi:hypothetical protein